MADADKTYNIAIKTEGDASGVAEVAKPLDALAQQAEDSKVAFAGLQDQISKGLKGEGFSDDAIQRVTDGMQKFRTELDALVSGAGSPEAIKTGLEQMGAQMQALVEQERAAKAVAEELAESKTKEAEALQKAADAATSEQDQISKISSVKLTDAEASAQWARTNQGAYHESAEAAEGYGEHVEKLGRTLYSVRDGAGAAELGLGALEGVVEGTGWGLIVMLIGEAVAKMFEMGQEAKKAELEKRAEEAKEFARGMGELAKSASEAFDERVKHQLDAYVESLKKMGEEWERSKNLAKEYYDFIDQKAGAQAGLDKANNEVARQQALKGVTDKDQQRKINESFDQKERDIDEARKLEANTQKQKSADEDLARAKKTAEEIAWKMPETGQELAEVNRRIKMGSPDVHSDQDREMERYRAALNKVASTAGNDQPVGNLLDAMKVWGGVGSDTKKTELEPYLKTIRDAEPNLPELRRRIASGDVTYDEAKKSGNAEEAKKGVDAADEHKADLDIRDNLKKSLAEMRVAQDKANMEVERTQRAKEILETERQTIEADAQAKKLKSENQDTNADLKSETKAAKVEDHKQKEGERKQKAEGREKDKEQKKEEHGAHSEVAQARDDLKGTTGEVKENEKGAAEQIKAAADAIRGNNEAAKNARTELKQIAAELAHNPTAEGLKELEQRLVKVGQSQAAPVQAMLRNADKQIQLSESLLTLAKRQAAKIEQLETEVRTLSAGQHQST